MAHGKCFFSNLFKEYASKDKVYSHIGIVTFENETAYVIHVEASELTGVGGVKIEELGDFLNGINTFTFFRVKANNQVKSRIAHKSKHYLNNRIKFDLNFDSSDDSEMYCTEFVAKCINYAFGKDLITPSIQLNNKFYFGLDDINRCFSIGAKTPSVPPIFLPS